jgi:hypothetical protein
LINPALIELLMFVLISHSSSWLNIKGYDSTRLAS